jgi:hypothetical protein
MPKAATLSLTLGTYHIDVDAKQTHLKVKKPVQVNGVWKEVDRWIPMTKVILILTNSKGGAVLFQATSMGKRTTVSRQTDLPPEMVKSLLATGPAMVERGNKPLSMSLDHAMGTIIRMTGASAVQVAQLFDFDAIGEHGTLTVTESAHTMQEA